MTAPDLIPLVSSDDREAWLEMRARGVTASEVHQIANGGRATWRRILDDKLNGSTFTGNRHTRRGNEREPFLIAFAESLLGATIEANTHLYAHEQHSRHMATPDALGDDMEPFGIEVKSHDYGWTRTDIPADHYDQMQWGMHVLGFRSWFYVFEVMGEDGEPTLADPFWAWVDRDEERIAQLVAAADAFLEWWDAGAPAADDIPAELDEALTEHAEARARKTAAEKDEKAAEKKIRDYISAAPGAQENGLKVAGTAASFNFSVTHAEVLDEEAWAQAEPESFAAYEHLKARLAASVEAATELYHRSVPRTRLTITPNKEAA